MKKEEIVKKIRVFLGIVKEKFQTAKLADGSEISFDSLEINREVYDADGNALKEGEYILEDGTKFVVDENGVIKEIVKPNGEETKEEVVEEMADGESKGNGEDKPKVDANGNPITQATPDSDPDTNDAAKDNKPKEEPTNDPSAPAVEDRIAQLENKVDELYEMLLAITEKIQASDNRVEETVEEFKKLKSQPSATPLHFNKSEEDTPKTRIEKLKMLKNNK